MYFLDNRVKNEIRCSKQNKRKRQALSQNVLYDNQKQFQEVTDVHHTVKNSYCKGYSSYTAVLSSQVTHFVICIFINMPEDLKVSVHVIYKKLKKKKSAKHGSAMSKVMQKYFLLFVLLINDKAVMHIMSQIILCVTIKFFQNQTLSKPQVVSIICNGVILHMIWPQMFERTLAARR